jgi:phage tail sheath gpL-like
MTNLPPNNLNPGSFLQLNIPFGPGSSITAPQKTLYIGNKLASAPAVVNQLYGPDVPGFVVQSHADVLNTFGAGSEPNVAYNAGVLNDNSVTTKYFICPPESTGSAASLAVTFTGTATTFGTVVTNVAGQALTASIPSGYTFDEVASAVATAVNASVELPVSASATDAVVTFTAKNKGPRGNRIYLSCQVSGGLQGVTSSGQTAAYFSGGSVEDNWVGTLLAIANHQFDLIVSAAEDSTAEGNAGLLLAQVTEQNLAVPGLQNFMVDGYVGTEAQAAAFQADLNGVFQTTAWELNSSYLPIQLAAHYAGAIACSFFGQSTPLWNMDATGVRTGPVDTTSFWQFTVPFDGTQTSPTDVVNALVSGLTPIVTTSQGKTAIAKAVTGYFLDTNSETLDLRATDLCDPFIGNESIYALRDMWADQFAGTTAAQNPQPGDKAPNELVTTPDILTASCNKALARQVSNGNLQAFVVNDVTLSDEGLFTAVVEVQPVTLSHQFSVDINVLTSVIGS